MKILVFGKTGQVASELQRHEGVVALSRSDADLANPEACAAIIEKTDADVVINAAAYTNVDKAEEDEALATIINGHSPTAMANVAAKRRIPFIHISTDYVFDGRSDIAWSPEDSTSPLGAYGRSKLLGEQGVIAANGTFVILRTSWVFSSHGINFLKTMLRLSGSKASLDIVADQIGGPTAASDIAAACLKIARALVDGSGASGIYHIAGLPEVSWADFAREIFRQSGRETKIIDIATQAFPTPAERPKNSRLNGDSLAAVFGIERPDWRVGVTNVLEELGELK